MKSQYSSAAARCGRCLVNPHPLALGLLSLLLLVETPVAAAVKTWVHGAANNLLQVQRVKARVGGPAVNVMEKSLPER